MSNLIQEGIQLIEKSNSIAPIKTYGHPFINKINRQGDAVGVKPLGAMGDDFMRNQLATMEFMNKLNASENKREVMRSLEKHAKGLKYNR